MSYHSVKVADRKKELRAVFREKRDSLLPEDKARRDSAICKYAVNLATFRHAERILLYAPIGSEIDVMPIASEALRRGKRVYFPRCCKESRTMTFHQVSSFDELEGDAYGIPAPPESAPAYDFSDSADSLCIIPGMIYDKNGYRVGYGGGYYDRFLMGYKGCKIGVIYSDFIIDKVPRGHFDHRVDIMLTEKNVRIPLES